MTEKQYILIPFEEGNLIFKDDGREFFNSVDCLKDNEIVDLLNEQDAEIKQLEKELSQIKETFQFTIAQNYTEDNKDEIHIKDSYTEIYIKNGRLCLKIYPPNTEPYDFYYRVAGTLITHEKVSTKNINPKLLAKYLPEHMPIISKKTEKSCHHCTHHDYDEYNYGNGDYDEYEVCRKNHDLDNGPCEDYEEL